MRKPVRVLGIIVVLIALGAGGWLFASPWIAMDSLRDAAREGDQAALTEQIDFPALRSSVKEGITRQAMAHAQADGAADMLAGAGAALASGFAGRLVDTLITPQGMSALLVSGSLIPRPEGHDVQEIDWQVDREGLSTFRAWPQGEDGQAYPALVFHRTGLSWKLVGIDIPDDGLDKD